MLTIEYFEKGGVWFYHIPHPHVNSLQNAKRFWYLSLSEGIAEELGEDPDDHEDGLDDIFNAEYIHGIVDPENQLEEIHRAIERGLEPDLGLDHIQISLPDIVLRPYLSVDTELIYGQTKRGLTTFLWPRYSRFSNIHCRTSILPAVKSFGGSEAPIRTSMFSVFHIAQEVPRIDAFTEADMKYIMEIAREGLQDSLTNCQVTVQRRV